MTEQTAAGARPPRHVMSVDLARAHESQRTGGGPDKRGLVELLERLQLLPDPHSAARHVEKIRDGHPATSAAALAKKEVNATVLRCTGIGVVAGLPGSIPGLGTFAQACATLGIAGGEAAILLRNVARLQYTVAGLYGHDLFAPERIDELLIVAGLESGAILPAREAGTRVGTKIAVKQFDRHVSGEMLRKVNTKLGTTVLAKYGTKRGGVALGRMVPFGVGATIGGGVNFLVTKSFGRAILRYYGQIEPGGEMLFVPADTWPAFPAAPAPPFAPRSRRLYAPLSLVVWERFATDREKLRQRVERHLFAAGARGELA